MMSMWVAEDCDQSPGGLRVISPYPVPLPVSITTFDQLGLNDPREEHYTITLAKLPDVQARLRWVLEQVERAPVTALGVEVPPALLREALDKIEALDRSNARWQRWHRQQEERLRVNVRKPR